MKEACRPPVPSGPNSGLTQEESAYLRRCCELDAAKIIQLHNQSLSIRQELEQKRRGFTLMAELAVTLGQDSNYDQVFVSVSKRINAALNMQRTVVLAPCSGKSAGDSPGKSPEKSANGQARLFRPLVLQGYTAEEEQALLSRRVSLDAELLDPERPVLITGADSPDRLAPLRQSLGLPFFISAPVILHNKVMALLITGRLLEKLPFMPRLGRNDMETVQTVSAYLAAMLAGAHMAEAEERTRLMLDATPLSCNFWDERIRLLDCNEEALRLFSLPSKREYLTRFPDFSPMRQPGGQLSMELARKKIREAFASGYQRFEWMHQKADGEPIPSEVTLVRVKRGEGHIVMAYVRDLREQKLMLEAIRKKEDDLRMARDLAEQNAKIKSEFLANMSHEIRTPMNAILGMTHLLAATELTEKQRGYVEQAAHSANLLLHIINDVLDFSKIEAGRMEMESIAFAPHRLTANVLELMHSQAVAKSLDLSFSVDPGVPYALLGDPMRLEQVLLNLISNAIKFTKAGGVFVRVSLLDAAAGPLPGSASCGWSAAPAPAKGRHAPVPARRHDTPLTHHQDKVPQGMGSNGETARLLFEVTDTGIGMTQEQLTGLFTAFSQADSSTTRKYGGTGLGLAISRSLVGLMDGGIWCDSRSGEGSTFSFTAAFALPPDGTCVPDAVDGAPDNSSGYAPDGAFASSPADGAARLSPDASPLSAPDLSSERRDTADDFADLRGMRVLLAEDNDINQMIAIELLAAKGIEVDAVDNGREAVEALLGGTPYDVVLMDIQMPEMDGLTATERIRADKRFDALPIVAMTAHAMSEDRELSLHSGMNDHLTKPIAPRHLYRALRHWKQGARQA